MSASQFVILSLKQAILGEINKALKDVSLADIQGGLLPSGYAINDDAISYEAGH